MSIFSQDLDKGGVLRDVAIIKSFSYANGLSVNISRGIAACDTVEQRDTTDDNYIFVDPPEFDHDSNWPLLMDGFLCNRGEIKYSQIFSEEYQKSINPHHEITGELCLGDISDAALNGHIETLFVPYSEDLYWPMRSGDPRSRYPEFKDRWVKSRDWWKLVESAIKEGFENAIDPKVNAKVFITPIGTGWTSTTDESLNNRFFVTIKIYSHKDIGDILWFYESDRQLPQLSGIDPNFDAFRGYGYRLEGSRPVSISTRLDIEYKGYENIH